MTARKDLKRLVRARARKTGESYAAALRHLRKAIAKAQQMASPHPVQQPPEYPQVPLRRIEKPEHGFALQLPTTWREESPDLINSPWEVARFSSSEPGRQGCLVFRNPVPPELDAQTAARRAQPSLERTGFGNFKLTSTTLAGKPAARLEFDKVGPQGRWSVRGTLVIAGGHCICLSFGTWSRERDAPLIDQLVTTFELLDQPPGPSAESGPSATLLPAAAETRPQPQPPFQIDQALRLRLQPYTTRAHRALLTAHQDAKRRGDEAVDQQHLLAGIATELQPSDLATLGRFGIAPDVLQRIVATILPRAATAQPAGQTSVEPAAAPAAPSNTFRLTDRADRLLALAEQEARALGHTFVGLEHLAFALLRQGSGPGFDLLQELGVTLDQAHALYQRYLAGRRGPTDQAPSAR